MLALESVGRVAFLAELIKGTYMEYWSHFLLYA